MIVGEFSSTMVHQSRKLLKKRVGSIIELLQHQKTTPMNIVWTSWLFVLIAHSFYHNIYPCLLFQLWPVLFISLLMKRGTSRTTVKATLKLDLAYPFHRLVLEGITVATQLQRDPQQPPLAREHTLRTLGRAICSFINASPLVSLRWSSIAKAQSVVVLVSCSCCGGL